MKKLRVALIYNAYAEGIGDSEIDHGGSWDLRRMIRRMARSSETGTQRQDRPPVGRSLRIPAETPAHETGPSFSISMTTSSTESL